MPFEPKKSKSREENDLLEDLLDKKKRCKFTMNQSNKRITAVTSFDFFDQKKMKALKKSSSKLPLVLSYAGKKLKAKKVHGSKEAIPDSMPNVQGIIATQESCSLNTRKSLETEVNAVPNVPSIAVTKSLLDCSASAMSLDIPTHNTTIVPPVTLHSVPISRYVPQSSTPGTSGAKTSVLVLR